MPRIAVTLPEAAYDVVIEPGLLRQVGQFIDGPRAIVVTDDHLARHHLPALREALAGMQIIETIVPAGEKAKSLEHLSRIYDAALGGEGRIERMTPLLALGGGVVTDLGGFAAATLLRGLPYYPIPTSLLAMVDASVGGKTGINHAAGKNLIGSFHHPRAVLIDPTTLKTLPDPQLREGLAECIKHEIIRDADGFDRLEAELPRILARDETTLVRLVGHNVEIKARVVMADPYEHGQRAHLNFGHTFAHAFEKVSHLGISHGEAVAVGMVAASRMAVELKLIDAATAERIERLIAAAGLPTSFGRGHLSATPDSVAVCDAMLSDKKVKGGKIRFILPERIGSVVIRDDVPEPVVREAVASVCNG